MKLAIVDGDGTFPAAGAAQGCVRRRLPFALHRDFVVDSEFAFGHSRKVRLHHHFARNVGTQDLLEFTRKIDMTSVEPKIKLLPDLPFSFSLRIPTCPWGDMSRLTLSRTSKKSSFLRYLIPSRRQAI